MDWTKAVSMDLLTEMGSNLGYYWDLMKEMKMEQYL